MLKTQQQICQQVSCTHADGS